MGLGFSKISVPSMIADSGLISDSFSMCFGVDGDGQLNFGDKGSADQFETKLNTDTKYVTFLLFSVFLCAQHSNSNILNTFSGLDINFSVHLASN